MLDTKTSFGCGAKKLAFGFTQILQFELTSLLFFQLLVT